MIHPFAIPRRGESWDEAQERAVREDVGFVLEQHGQHSIEDAQDDFLYPEGVVRYTACAMCGREVVRQYDFEGPWVHRAPGIDPPEAEG